MLCKQRIKYTYKSVEDWNSYCLRKCFVAYQQDRCMQGTNNESYQWLLGIQAWDTNIVPDI